MLRPSVSYTPRKRGQEATGRKRGRKAADSKLLPKTNKGKKRTEDSRYSCKAAKCHPVTNKEKRTGAECKCISFFASLWLTLSQPETSKERNTQRI